MDGENVVHVHKEILYSCKEEQREVKSLHLQESRGAKLNAGQVLRVFSHLPNLYLSLYIGVCICVCIF